MVSFQTWNLCKPAAWKVLIKCTSASSSTTLSYITSHDIFRLPTSSVKAQKVIFSHVLFSVQIVSLVSFGCSRGASWALPLLPALRLIVGPALLAVSCPSPCALSLSLMQVCEGRALQLITDLPVEFHCNKGTHSHQWHGENLMLAAAIALLRGVSKMKRLDFEARLFPKTLNSA